MSLEETSKKLRGFSEEQSAVVRNEINVALSQEGKRINDRMLQLVNELSTTFTNKFDTIIRMLQEEKNPSSTNETIRESSRSPSKATSASPVPGPMSPASGSIPNYPSSTLGSSSRSTIPSRTEKPTAAIDSNQRLPSNVVNVLSDKDVTPEDYRRWAIRIAQSIKGLSKYEGILDKPPDVSWTLFQNRNRKYFPSDLECHYLDVHRSVCGYISRGIDPGLAEEIEEQLKVEALTTNLSMELEFDFVDDSFYENAYQYWEKIKSRYLLKSAYQITRILDERDSLKYDGKQDPATYIARHNQLKNRRKLLIPSYPDIPEFLRAIEILHGLPKTSSLDAMKSQFYNRENGVESITVKEVEEALRHWWADQSTPLRTSRRDTYSNSRSKQPGGLHNEDTPDADTDAVVMYGTSPRDQHRRRVSRSRSPRGKTYQPAGDQDSGSEPETFSF